MKEGILKSPLYHDETTRKALEKYAKNQGRITLEQAIYRLVTRGLKRSGELKTIQPFTK